MSYEKLIPCESDGMRYATNICSHLRGELKSSDNKRAKGLFVDSVVSVADFSKMGERVTYRSGDGKSVILNFCPFCGGKLHGLSDDGE